MDTLGLEKLDFKAITKRRSPNHFLLCPQGFSNLTEHRISPQFACDSQQLAKHWHAVISLMPRLTVLHHDNDEQHYEYCQRSFIFHFPDFISVKLIPLTPHSSTIAIYSRSRYGYSDLGANQKRVNYWLATLKKQIDTVSPTTHNTDK